MKLQKVLGRRDVFALAFGAIIGWGWVVLSGPMIDQAGSLGSVAAVLMGGVMVSLVGLTYAELTAALPRAGGELGFTYVALGPAWSWWCGWWLAFAYVGICAFEAVAIGTVLTSVAPQVRGSPAYSLAGSPVYAPALIVGPTMALVIGAVNWRGTKLSAGLQWAATAGLLAVGVSLFLAAGVRGEVTNLEPRFLGWHGVLSALTVTPFLFVGFDVIPQAAEEIRIPRRQIGSVILFSIVLAAAWYSLVQLSVGVGLPFEEHAVADLPTAAAASRLVGSPVAGWVIVLGGLLGILTSWNAFFIGATRLLFAMGRGGLLPAAWARLHDRYGTPIVPIVFVTTLSMLAPFLGRQALLWLANAASLATVIAFTLVAVAFVRLRLREPDMERPYRVAGGSWLGPLAVAVTGGFVLLYLPPSPSALTWPYEWGIIAAWVVAGGAVFMRTSRSAAWRDQHSRARALLGEFARQAD
jgi:APA family basic amino acid/polyamine antiporter